MNLLTDKMLDDYEKYLISQEKSRATIQKYLHDVSEFKNWIQGQEVTREKVLEYKKYVLEKHAVSSVNSYISSINSLFSFAGWNDFKVRTIKTQRNMFLSHDKELTKSEYLRLLTAASNKKEYRLYFLLQCICSTGIRVSEIKYVTVESLNKGKTEIYNKGKCRVVFFPSKLCKALKKYAKSAKIKSGAVFVSKNGKPLDRSNIWTSMKKLCADAKVSPQKVFPHNLRHLFARTYYSMQKDIVRLSDILGHSNINTTRIYTKECGEIYRQQIQKLGLLRC